MLLQTGTIEACLVLSFQGRRDETGRVKGPVSGKFSHFVSTDSFFPAGSTPTTRRSNVMRVIVQRELFSKDPAGLLKAG